MDYSILASVTYPPSCARLLSRNHERAIHGAAVIIIFARTDGIYNTVYPGVCVLGVLDIKNNSERGAGSQNLGGARDLASAMIPGSLVE